MRRRAERIEDVLKSVIEKLDKSSNPTSDEINSIWEKIAGKEAFLHARPASLRKKHLVINVDSSGWLYELTLRKEKLLEGLQKKLGKAKIKELQFRIGEL